MAKYEGVEEGQIERIDPPNPKDRNVERCFDVFWEGANLRFLTIEKWADDVPVLVVRGGGDDVVWWARVASLKHYAFFDVKVNRTLAPRANGCVMTVAVLVQEIDAGKQEEWRDIITNFPIPDPITATQGVR